VFQQLDLSAAYLRLPTPEVINEGFLQTLEALGIRGASVTIPHKEAVLLDPVCQDDVVRALGAANTLVHGKDGWAAYNTDLPAAMDSLQVHRGEWADTRALVLGAGGVARSLAFGLVQKGANVTLSNRNPVRAQALAAEVGCQSIAWESRHDLTPDVVINCTPVGMTPHQDRSPVDSNWLQPDMIVFDTIYNPEHTLLLRQAAERGCVTITGVDMFVRQAALQVLLFTGQKAPEDQMRAVVLDALRPGSADTEVKRDET